MARTKLNHTHYVAEPTQPASLPSPLHRCSGGIKISSAALTLARALASEPIYPLLRLLPLLALSPTTGSLWGPPRTLFQPHLNKKKKKASLQGR